MSERMKTCYGAYAKGAKAASAGKPRSTCPYGFTKRQLLSWWQGGYSDYLDGHIDYKGRPVIDKGVK